MCTVTYIPDGTGFHLTSNRDEHISRTQAIIPHKYQVGKYTLLYPRDADKNGSWIAAKDNGDLIVLLNGAFVRHIQQAVYKKSRGVILMNIIKAVYPDQLFRQLDLDGIEPFTIILYVSRNLLECRWDGVEKHIILLDNQLAHIWSSVTLFDKMARAKRDSWFNDWRESAFAKTTPAIMHFHRYAGEGDLKDGLVINRNGLMKTMSITSIHVMPSTLTMTYLDLRNNQLYTNELALKKNDDVHTRQTHLPRWLALKSFMIRLTNWEYWPFQLIYGPVICYWFWLGLRSGSLFFFNTANPLIENGGFTMESKWTIYKLLPEGFTPRTLFFKAGTTVSDMEDSLISNNLQLPLIAKPDIGERGILVKKIGNSKDLEAYTQTVKVDFLLQEYIAHKNEVGIFYYRIPGEKTGHLSGIVGKEFLTVKGDGRSTITELLLKDPRYLLQLKDLLQKEPDMLGVILSDGEEKVLVPYGNHSRGAKFVDLSHLITEELTESVDRICQQIPQFYFGRMDIMYHSWEDLCKGKNFSIVELNGAGSEPTHIYDPKHRIFFAWKEITRHWKILNRISLINAHTLGLRFMTRQEGLAMLKKNTEYFKLVS